MKVLEREHVIQGGHRGDPDGAGGGLGLNRQFPSLEDCLQEAHTCQLLCSGKTSALAHREQCECKDTSFPGYTSHSNLSSSK